MHVKTEPEDLQNYLVDASNMPGGHAERLFLPETEEEVAAILKEANAAGVPVTVSGARTGTVGGAIPFGGFVISMERLNRIKSIDRAAMRAVVEPGVILGDLTKAVEAEGMFYPPDPTEWSCQIGGTIATNASGARSFKYGATREFVEALTVVLADGDVLRLRRGEAIADGGVVRLVTGSGREIAARVPTYDRPDVRKNVSGYFNEEPLDAIDLFIGSEGTLGVVVEAELRLLAKPEGFFSGIIFFERPADLLGFVEEVRARSLRSTTPAYGHPSYPGGELAGGQVARVPAVADEGVRVPIGATLLEYFDDRALGFIREKFPETPEGMAGAIFFEQETTAESEDELLEGWNELLEKHNAAADASWFTTTEADREKMRAFRHALPVSVNERVVRNGRKKIGTDMAVPDDRFPGFLHYQKEMLDASGIDYVIFGHIGDCHLHANLLPRDDAEAERARHIYGRFVAQSIMLGGCISAEHGIGKLKRKYLYVAMGERYLNEMAELKAAFDPKGILGRGNMFDAG